jgi:NAD(P)-dependent dehydrogenase (short-subunit alcohol dehydrogenase family)
MPITLDLSNKIALITGSTKGIGFAIAKVFAQAGAFPIVHGTTPESVRGGVEKLHESGIKAAGYPADLTTTEATSHLIDTVIAEHGRIDILVNNAGTSHPAADIEKLTPQEWERVMAVNLTAPFLLAKQVLPSMKSRNSGNILNIGSEGYVFGSHSSNLAYTASKGGLVSLTKGLVRETEGYAIRVNAISPWHVRTEKLMNLLSHLPEHAQEDYLTKDNKLHAVCLPIDIANAALFLVSDQARFIHGTVLHINGGAGTL